MNPENAESPTEKLMTDAEWASLSAESRFKINAYFTAGVAQDERVEAAAERIGVKVAPYLPCEMSLELFQRDVTAIILEALRGVKQQEILSDEEHQSE